jgi:hypothetical protein
LVAKEGPAADLNVARTILADEISELEEKQQRYGNEEGIEILEMLDDFHDFPSKIANLERQLELIREEAEQRERSIRDEMEQREKTIREQLDPLVERAKAARRGILEQYALTKKPGYAKSTFIVK